MDLVERTWDDWLMQLSDYSQLSDYTVRLQLCKLIRAKYTCLCTKEIKEIVTVMNNLVIVIDRVEYTWKSVG